MAGSNQYQKQYANIIKTPQQGSAQYNQVQKDAQQEFQDRLKAIDMRIKQTQALREGDMASIRRNTAQAQNDIDEKMFREYLANKERMGGRGLSGSGLMADAQIRLNANKQDRLAELYTQQQDKISDVQRTYAPQQTELLGERQGTRKSKIFQEMFDKMLEKRQREAQLLQPMMQNEFSKNERINTQNFQSGESEKERKFKAIEEEKNRQATAKQNALTRAAEMERLRLELNQRANSDAMANTRAQADLDFKREEAELEKQNMIPEKRYLHYMSRAQAHRATADKALADISTADTQEEIDALQKIYTAALRKEQLAVGYAKRYLPK